MMYNIAGIFMEIISDAKMDFGLLKLFESAYDGQPYSKIELIRNREITVENEEIVLDDAYRWCKDRSGKTVIYVPSNIDNRIIAKFQSDKDWRNIRIYYKGRVNGIEEAIVRYFIYTVFRMAIIFNEGILIHASSFTWNGKGIIVTAPSGTGKSTHASLWEKHYGAVVVNDDCPAVRIINNEPILYGNPWSGSKIKFVNASVPLNSIIIIEQSEENYVRRLGNNEAAMMIIPRFILPFYDKSLIITATSHIKKIVDSVPIYHLKCKPDKEAVEKVISEIERSA